MKNPLRGLTAGAQMFVRCIVAGDTPEQAVRIAFSTKTRNLDVWAAKQLANPRIQRAIDELTKGRINPYARRIELLKIMESPKSSHANKLAALKELGRLDEAAPETVKKPVQDDEALQNKLHILGQKAAS